MLMVSCSRAQVQSRVRVPDLRRVDRRVRRLPQARRATHSRIHLVDNAAATLARVPAFASRCVFIAVFDHYFHASYHA